MTRLTDRPDLAAVFARWRAQHSMLLILAAALPALAVHTWFFGAGLLINFLLSAAAGLVAEALCLRLRHQPVGAGLADCSMLVTALLFAVMVPPGTSVWLLTAGMVFAIALVKHAYGGLGHYVFNPAMAGCLFLLLAFPLSTSGWQLTAAESGVTDSSVLLRVYQQALPIFSRDSGTGRELVNMAWLAGGMLLLGLRIISWQIPLTVIVSVLVLSMLLHSSGAVPMAGSPWWHLFGTATMVGAFFIATDPVTAATSSSARLLYGLLVGCCIYGLRVFGSSPDSVAIAVLFGNFCAPMLDHWCRPRRAGRNPTQPLQTGWQQAAGSLHSQAAPKPPTRLLPDGDNNSLVRLAEHNKR